MAPNGSSEMEKTFQHNRTIQLIENVTHLSSGMEKEYFNKTKHDFINYRNKRITLDKRPGTI